MRKIILGFVIFFFLLPVSTSYAANFSVNDAASLIAAINTANGVAGADVITLTDDIFISSTYLNTAFHGDMGLPLITSNITINGNGFLIRRDTAGLDLFRIITINGGTLTINDATISFGQGITGLVAGGGNILVANNGTLNLNNSIVESGLAYTGAGIYNFSGRININNSLIQVNGTFAPNQDGGGIYNAGTATITNSLILGNLTVQSDGGGIYNSGTMTITNSTVSSNITGALGDGAGIYNSGTLTLNNVTISENQHVGFSGGIYNSGTATVNNSIIVGNDITDCVLAAGTFTAGADNIVGNGGSDGGCTGGTPLAGLVATLIDPRADNGGPTQTYALVAGGPAIDASVGGTSSDQRGAAAVGTRDIGAYEYTGAVPTVTVAVVSASNIIESGGVATITVTVANLSAGNSLTVVANISGGTATNPGDYTITSSLIFNADGSQDFVITGLPDAFTEGNETLIVSFSLIGAADISGNGNQTVTIVEDLPPTFSKAFAPNPIAIGAISTLTLTIDNSSYILDTTSLDFTDNLPAGMVIATPANASTTCTGGTITAVDGSGVISYTGGTVSATSSCTITVDVTASSSGAIANTTNDLTSSTGNSGTASDTLNVIDTLGIGKRFVNDPVLAGGTVDLEFTVTNGDLLNDATGISFTDDLDATLSGLVATGLPLNDICGIGSQISGTNLLSFTGGTLTAGTSCTFTVTLQIPLGAALGNYTNTTSSVTGTLAGLAVTESPATDVLTIGTRPTTPSYPVSTGNTPSISVFDPAISKLGILAPGQIGVQGEVLEWIVTVTNTSSIAGQNVAITDTLNPALHIDSVDAPNATVTINGQTVTVSYATLNVGETVQFSIFTTVLNGVLVENTACVMAANQSAEECAMAFPVSQLPSTGESPFWRYSLLLGIGILILAALFIQKSRRA